MARDDQDEYFFDDADIERLDDSESESEGVVYDHDTETIDDSEVDLTESEEKEEFEEVSPFWLDLKDKAIRLFKSNKRLVYLLSVVLVIYVTADIMGFGIHRPHAAKRVVSPKPVPAAVKPVAKQAPAKSAPPLPGFGSGFIADTAQSSQSNSAVSSEVASLRAQVAEQAVTIHTLLQTVKTHGSADVAAAGASGNRVTALQGRVDQLTTQLGAMHHQLKTLTKAEQQAQYRASAGPQAMYHVRAVEPGRAWILARDGSSMSVSLSSVIPGYGKVTRIDYIAGIIATESGKMIRFAAQ